MCVSVIRMPAPIPGDGSGWRTRHAAFVLGCLLISGVWMDLDRLPWPWLLGLFSLFALLGVYVPRPGAEAEPRPGLPPLRPLPALGVVALAAGPALGYLALTWSQEFPFSGDHLHHVGAARVAFSTWRPLLAATFAVVAAVALWVRSGRASRWWPLAAGALLLAASFFFALPAPLVRYPGTFYFLALPFQAAVSAGALELPLNANRLANVAALPLWLLLLRPLLLRRWPDPAVLPFSAFYFLHKDVVYYVTSTYLEPWSLILLLMAVECLVAGDPRASWLVPLLAGGAALVKEQAFTFLPFLWLAASWPELRRRRWAPLVTGASAAAPFLAYVAARSAGTVHRRWYGASWPEIASAERLHELWHRLSVQFEGPALVAFLAVVAAGVVVLLASPRRRLTHGLLLAAAAVQVLVFHADAMAVAWTGYPRYQLHTLVVLSAPLLVLGYEARRAIASVLVAAVLALANLPGLASAFALAGRPDPARNFIEHYEAPVFFPLRGLFSRADRAAALEGVHRVRLVPWESYFGLVHPLTYPDLAGRYPVEVAPLQESQDACRCGDPRLAVVFVAVHWTGLNADRPRPPAQVEGERRCAEEMARTCRVLVGERVEGEIVGLLGRGGRGRAAGGEPAR